MQVTITNYTPDPIHHISRSAGLCYGRTDDKPSRVLRCTQMGHESILEHASVSFTVDGISRACSHQLVRHRMASYLQESQRYCKYDLSGDDWYIIPDAFSKDNDKNGVDLYYFYVFGMMLCGQAYQYALMKGIKPEDARYLLPEATKTRVAVTMNWREVFHFLDLRTDKAAQWEIRNVANALLDECDKIEDLKPMADLWRETRNKD